MCVCAYDCVFVCVCVCVSLCVSACEHWVGVCTCQLHVQTTWYLSGLYVGVWVCVGVCACVCVCERVFVRVRERQTETESLCVCVRVCVPWSMYSSPMVGSLGVSGLSISPGDVRRLSGNSSGQSGWSSHTAQHCRAAGMRACVRMWWAHACVTHAYAMCVLV